MSDIFISYSKSDRAKAQVLAKALEREGWSVRWDPKIPPGPFNAFTTVIAPGTGLSKMCTWCCGQISRSSSDRLRKKHRKESHEAFSSPSLVEDDVRIPMGFGSLHASRLTDWQEERRGDLVFDESKAAVAQHLRDLRKSHR